MYKSYLAPTYGTLWEFSMGTERAFTPEEYRLDHALLKVHLERLGGGTLFRVGFSKATFNGKFYKLDSMDYSRCVEEKNGEIWIPLSYACQYFGADLTDEIRQTAANSEGGINLNRVCAELKMTVTYHRESGLVMVAPYPVRALCPEKEPQFVARMSFAFEDPLMPEPMFNNSEQTRKVLAESHFPDGDYDWSQKRYINLYSPSLLITKDEQGRTVYYVAHENSVGVGWKEVRTETVLLCSYDRGETWEKIAVLDNVRWAYLFEVKGEIYLCGSRVHPDHAVVMAKLYQSVLRVQTFENIKTWTNPNAVVEKNGRIYLPTFPQVMSADIQTDLLQEGNWRLSNSLNDVTDKAWFFEETGADTADDFWLLEGNIVAGVDGKLYDILRIESQPNNGYAALLELSEDGKRLTREVNTNGMVELPTSVSKFCVKYDEATGLYLTLCNYPTLPTPIPSLGIHPLAGQRNILCLAASPDLIHWKVLDVLLCDREVMNGAASARAHGFQYVIWDTDGEDLLYVVREAVGYTKNFHDGKFVTLYRLKNYKTFVTERYGKTDFWSNPARKRT